MCIRDRSAMCPHTGTRAPMFSSGSTASNTAPPTFSKYTNALGTGIGQALRELRVAAVETGVEPELLDGVATLVGSARDADHPRTFDLRDLPDVGADRASGRGNYNGFTGAGLTDVEQADVGGEPRHAERAERKRRLLHVAERQESGAIRHRELLPPGVAEDQVADVMLRMPGSDDAVDGAAGHGLTERYRRGIDGRHFVHHLAHVRIERQVQGVQ